MVACVTPVLEQHMPRAQAHAGGQDAHVRFDFGAYLDSSTSTTQVANETLDQSHVAARERAGEYCCNQQYSVTAITTSTGTIAERYAYSAYGQPTFLDASGSILSTSSISNRYTYTGREWDATLGLYHFRARWMSPSAGRFLGRDPIGYEDGQSLFSSLVFLVKVDPHGTSTMVDDSNPDSDGIKGPEKRFLDGCECGLIKDRTVKPKEGESWVACDGNGGFKIRRQKDVDIEDFECLKNCGALDCIGDHEKHHIKQFKLRCPNACRGGCGVFPGPDDGVMGFQEDCLKYAECYAGRVTLNCINRKQFDKTIANSNCGGKTCREWLVIFFRRYTDAYESRYKCASPMELPQWIDPEK